MFNANDSLRSKRFQSSYSAKFGAGAKKKSPPPPPSFLFLLSFQFSRRTRAGTACYAGYANDDERYNVT